MSNQTDFRFMEDIFSPYLQIVVEEAEDPQQNVDLDEVLAAEVANGSRPETIRLWRHADVPGLVVSRKDIAGAKGAFAIAEMKRMGVPIFVRRTGGTAVPHTRGVLNISMMFKRSAKKQWTTDTYYRLLCQPLLAWLQTFDMVATTGEVPGSYCDGSYNVIVDGRKLVGTAQTWRGGLAGVSSRHPGYILAHACMTVEVDLAWSMKVINHFYEAVGDPYRVHNHTSITLNEALLTHRHESFGQNSNLAMSSLQQFLYQYYGVGNSI